VSAIETSVEQIHPLLHYIDRTKYSAERVQSLWDHLQTQDYAFDDTTRGDSTAFLSQFLMPNNLLFEVGEMEGFVSAVGVTPRVQALLHFSIWGKLKITDVLMAGKALNEFLFNEFQLNRLSAFIPNQNINARRLALLLGFKEEGNLRKAWLSHDNYQDIIIFGLLRSEWDRFKRI
jgi:hypothetical protein